MRGSARGAGFNLAPIVQPRSSPTDTQICFYAKKTSASRLEEHVRVPSAREVRAYSTTHLNLTPMICLDFYDASQVLSLIKWNHQEDLVHEAPSQKRIDLVSVLSYGMNQHGKTLEALAESSSLLGVPIVFCHSKASEVDCTLCFGGDFPEAAEQVNFDGDAMLKIYTIKSADYRDQIKQSRMARDPFDQFLRPLPNAKGLRPRGDVG